MFCAVGVCCLIFSVRIALSYPKRIRDRENELSVREAELKSLIAAAGESKRESELLKSEAQKLYSGAWSCAKSALESDLSKKNAEEKERLFSSERYRLELAQKECVEKQKALEGLITALAGDCREKACAEIISDFSNEVVLKFYEKLCMRAGSYRERVNALRENFKQVKQDALFYKYKTLRYEESFPELMDYCELEAATDVSDPVVDDSNWLSSDEWNMLPDCEKSQLALDRYVASSNKSKKRIGLDFELYVGWRFRKKGWRVEQFGTNRGLSDLGRDIIARKDNRVCIVQCKCWSVQKQIHEKHINQLFGTTVEYALSHGMKLKGFPDLHTGRGETVEAFLCTTTKLSETASAFASALGISVCVVTNEWQKEQFPRIKCNLEEKIFHLPFDQQYDNTQMELKGRFFALTVQEAVDKGCRRAYRCSVYS